MDCLILLVLLELLLKEGKISNDVVNLAYDKISELIISKFENEKKKG